MREDAATEDATTEEAATRDHRRGWLLVICWFVAVDAVGFQMRGALLPELRREFGASEAVLGLVAPAGTVGLVVTVLLVGALAGRLDLKRTLLLGAVAATASVALVGLSPVFALFLAALLLRGVSTGLARGVDRPVLSHLYPDVRGRVFNLYDLAWAIGASAGPVLVVVALAVGEWRLAYGLLAVGFLPVVVIVYRLPLALPSGLEEPLRLEAIRPLLARPRIAGVTVAMVVSGGIEGSLFTWLPYYATGLFAESTASLTLSALVLGYVPGRILYSAIAERVGYLSLVAGLGVVALPVIVLAFFVASGAGFFLAIGLLGFVWSGMFPTLAAYAVDAAPEYSGPVNAIATGASYGGVATVPVALGLVAERADIVVAMRSLLLLAVAFVAIVVATGALARRSDVETAGT